MTVEVPAEGQSPPLHRVSPTLIPQVHLFNENNQKVGDVSYSDTIQFPLVSSQMIICTCFCKNGSENIHADLHQRAAISLHGPFMHLLISTFVLFALTLDSLL